LSEIQPMKSNNRKSDGFEGEKIIEIPKQIVAACQKIPLISPIFITRMGFYPKAANHYFQRPNGISQTIIIYCTNGKGWIKMNNKRFPLQAGDFTIISSGVPHSYGSDKETPWTIHWFHLQEKTPGSLQNSLPGHDTKLVHNIDYDEERISIFDKIYATFTGGYSSDLLLFANLLFGYFFASLIQPQAFKNNNLMCSGTTISEKAIQFMKANIKSVLTVHEIATQCDLSVSFFSRKFKHETGYTPVEYLNYLKIQKACQLLHLSKLRVNALITEIGITDPFYFSRLFKKQMGVSPLQYRKNDGVD
jgi:AraC-like DNA-binding protein